MKGLARENIIIDNTQQSLRILIYLPGKEAFILHLQLHMKVESSTTIRIGSSSGKVEVDLLKCEPLKWQGLGSPLDNHLWFGPTQVLVLILKLRVDISCWKDLALTYRDWTVTSITPITHDTKHIELQPPPGTVFSVPTGHHVHIKGVVEGGVEISRSYTPVTLFQSIRSRSRLDLLVKIYPDGALTPQLGQLCPGKAVSVSDHTGTYSQAHLAHTSTIYLLAAGTGCTPVFSLLAHLAQSRAAIPTILLFFNKTLADIIWQEELAELQSCQPWLSVVHVLSEETGEGWDGERGRVRKDLLGKYIEKAKEGSFAAVCGPKGFTVESDRLLKEEYQFQEEQIHLFQGWLVSISRTIVFIIV